NKELIQQLFKGKVVDENGQLMLGASIAIANTERRTKTNEDGEFEIAASTGELIEISYLGYKTLRYKITEKSSQNVFRLIPLEATVEEVTVTGLFNRPTENFTGAATAVSGQQLRNINALNVFDALKVL